MPPLKIIHYQQLPDDIFSNSNVSPFSRVTPAPKIVLRVPDALSKSDEMTLKRNNLLYNSIEKELIKAGFSVRDRILFNEIFKKAGGNDYSGIKNLTDTDLILEVVNIDAAIIYSTHTVTWAYKKKQKQKMQDIVYRSYGASVEYKLIMVKTNEISATYKYNYQPCANGCEVDSFIFYRKNRTETALKETVPTSILETFIQYSVQNLIKTLKTH